jgi:archaellin
MSTWNKVVLENSTGGIDQNTEGTASSLKNGVLLQPSQGGTGANLDSKTGIVIQKGNNGSYGWDVISSNQPGHVLTYSANGVQFEEAPAIRLNDQSDIITTSTDNVVFSGDVTINGTLNANIIDYEFDVSASDMGVIVLNNNGTTLNNNDKVGMLMDLDGTGNSQVSGIVYKKDSTNGDGFKAIINGTESDLAILETGGKPTTETGFNGVGSLKFVNTGTTSDQGLYIRTA